MEDGQPGQGAQERRRRIHAAVAAIPPGAVASYGQVAAQAGLPRGARLVGRVLADCPQDLPWHRVLTAAGRIALPPGSASAREQLRRLRAEGVEVRNGRVPRRLLDAHARLDALLWGWAADDDRENRDEKDRPGARNRRADAGRLRRTGQGQGCSRHRGPGTGIER
ncbi:MAG: MGMT family protein [Gammaproteobacteria bacterium]|nr:MGMT family protein [Gammaproteobacteria bacterium]